MVAGNRWLLLGGLASGKSVVRSMFEDAGLATIDSDSVGHQVLEPEGEAFEAVADIWPEVLVDGRIDRSALGTLVFGDIDQLRTLEGITHPHIFGKIRAQVERIGGPIVVELPVLNADFEEQWGRMVVDTIDLVRRERALGRGMSGPDAEARIASQPSRSEWLAAADIAIPNHGSEAELKQTIRPVVERLRT